MKHQGMAFQETAQAAVQDRPLPVPGQPDVGPANDTPANDTLANDTPAVGARRILYVDHTAKLGGGEIALLHLVQYLDRARFEPVVVLTAEGPLREKLRAAGVETHLIALSTSVLDTRKDSLGLGTLLRLSDIGRTLRCVTALARLIRAQNITLVHTNSLKSDIFGGAAARLARVPLVWHVRDRIDADYLPPAVVWAFRRLCRWVPQFVIANSQSTMETLALPRQKTGRQRVAAVYSGIDIAARTRVVHDGTERGPAPDRAASAPGAARIGLIGRISPWKGQHVFLRAAALVREKFPETCFQIIGAALFDEQAYEREIRSLTRDLGLEDSVEFLGFREDVPELVASLDVIVHASTSAEPFGQVIVEGMVAGKPVIATDGGGPREIVIPGETGLLIPMGDAEAMAEAITFLLEHPETAGEMGRRGQERAVEFFSIERTARKVEAVYDDLLKSGK